MRTEVRERENGERAGEIVVEAKTNRKNVIIDILLASMKAARLDSVSIFFYYSVAAKLDFNFTVGHLDIRALFTMRRFSVFSSPFPLSVAPLALQQAFRRYHNNSYVLR